MAAKSGKASGEAAAPSDAAANFGPLPFDDVPPDSPAHASVRYQTSGDRYAFQWLDKDGKRDVFQATVKRAGGSHEAAARIARLCFVKHRETGISKEELVAYRDTLYAQLDAVLPASAAKTQDKAAAAPRRGGGGAAPGKAASPGAPPEAAAPKAEEAVAEPAPTSASAVATEAPADPEPPAAGARGGRGRASRGRGRGGGGSAGRGEKHPAPQPAPDEKQAARKKFRLADLMQDSPSSAAAAAAPVVTPPAAPAKDAATAVDEEAALLEAKLRKQETRSALLESGALFAAMEAAKAEGRLEGAIIVEGRHEDLTNASINGLYALRAEPFQGAAAYEKLGSSKPRFLFFSPSKAVWKISDKMSDQKTGFAFARAEDGGRGPPKPELRWKIFDGPGAGYNKDKDVRCRELSAALAAAGPAALAPPPPPPAASQGPLCQTCNLFPVGRRPGIRKGKCCNKCPAAHGPWCNSIANGAGVGKAGAPAGDKAAGAVSSEDTDTSGEVEDADESSGGDSDSDSAVATGPVLTPRGGSAAPVLTPPALPTGEGGAATPNAGKQPPPRPGGSGRGGGRGRRAKDASAAAPPQPDEGAGGSPRAAEGASPRDRPGGRPRKATPRIRDHELDRLRLEAEVDRIVTVSDVQPPSKPLLAPTLGDGAVAGLGGAGAPKRPPAPKAPKGRACAKMLVRAGLRCKCHYKYPQECEALQQQSSADKEADVVPEADPPASAAAAPPAPELPTQQWS